MRFIKLVVKLLTIVSFAIIVITGNVIAAISLLALGSMSLGILIGEKIDGARKYENRSN